MSEAKELKFEDAMTQLEQTVMAMESGQLSLEDSMKHFTKATKLTKFCETKLGEFEQKIEVLVNESSAANPQGDWQPMQDENIQR